VLFRLKLGTEGTSFFGTHVIWNSEAL